MRPYCKAICETRSITRGHDEIWIFMRLKKNSEGIMCGLRYMSM